MTPEQQQHYVWYTDCTLSHFVQCTGLIAAHQRMSFSVYPVTWLSWVGLTVVDPAGGHQEVNYTPVLSVYEHWCNVCVNFSFYRKSGVHSLKLPLNSQGRSQRKGSEGAPV